MMAWVPSTEGAQPEMVPSSVSNRKTAAAGPLPLAETLNPPLAPPKVLNTAPVGVPSVPRGSAGGGPGIFTTSDCGVPAVLYSVDTPVPLSETQNGLPPLSAMPQGLTRWGSRFAATPGRSDTRFVCSTLPARRRRSSSASRLGRSAGAGRRRGGLRCLSQVIIGYSFKPISRRERPTTDRDQRLALRQAHTGLVPLESP